MGFISKIFVINSIPHCIISNFRIKPPNKIFPINFNLILFSSFKPMNILKQTIIEFCHKQIIIIILLKKLQRPNTITNKINP